MKITKLEPIVLAIPFTHVSAKTGFGGRQWKTLDYLVLRVETDAGVVGYGEGFGYNIIPATKTALEAVVAPMVIGLDPADIGSIASMLERSLQLFGRSGPAVYAMSALNIALWDIAGKVANTSTGALMGAGPRTSVSAYASLLWLGDEGTVARATEQAANDGFRTVKLHETHPACVAAARAAVGPDTALALDVNCMWSLDEAVEAGAALAEFDLAWWEEPLWPPESAAELRDLRAAVAIPLAAGENATTLTEISALAAQGGCDFVQPSVTKVGGITGFMRLADEIQRAGSTVLPHSPYFGPGLLATLQLAAVIPAIETVEYLWARLEAPLFGDIGLPDASGQIAIPTGPGLGADPDPGVLRRYRVA